MAEVKADVVYTDAPLDDPDEASLHYYDHHPTREDLMGESVAHSWLIAYVQQVLEWLYGAERWFVVNDLNIYRTRSRYEYPVAPDVAVFKGVVLEGHNRHRFRSWRLYLPERPPPQVVFEFCSESTWRDDLQQKPRQYAALGVREYFVYDPNDPPYTRRLGGRLYGWRIEHGKAVPLAPDATGRIWSAELASYLVADGAWLRFYDRDGMRRLTQAEAERAAKEAERAAKEAERAAKEAERAAKEAERAAKEAAWAKLRELGIDPSEL
ncbi:Uma2 family endonuclease [Candidatus Chloroploca sp. M-50]|uniref:Uma2 family endonuclease n=1 Tax=Candidatus Chloroploca mongolica TaxID=2528176 RepID=A0ABS4D7F1_9CHLR|nr:Uma2 family endonuclease [Candidatus Chloroploca mongolica]MBP1465340.1 Uma2 family endonuclease [Candidatus Chloroploca mongolica]